MTSQRRWQRLGALLAGAWMLAHVRTWAGILEPVKGCDWLEHVRTFLPWVRPCADLSGRVSAHIRLIFLKHLYLTVILLVASVTIERLGVASGSGVRCYPTEVLCFIRYQILFIGTFNQFSSKVLLSERHLQHMYIKAVLLFNKLSTVP